MTTDMTVANEICRQIGDRAFLMLGTSHKVGTDKALIFNIRGSKAVNKVRVTLDPSDTYTMEFFKMGRAPRFDIKVVAEVEDVYCDMLRPMIEKYTGLYTSL